MKARRRGLYGGGLGETRVREGIALFASVLALSVCPASAHSQVTLDALGHWGAAPNGAEDSRPGGGIRVGTALGSAGSWFTVAGEAAYDRSAVRVADGGAGTWIRSERWSARLVALTGSILPGHGVPPLEGYVGVAAVYTDYATREADLADGLGAAVLSGLLMDPGPSWLRGFAELSFGFGPHQQPLALQAGIRLVLIPRR